jgi:hypothetical protein
VLVWDGALDHEDEVLDPAGRGFMKRFQEVVAIGEREEGTSSRITKANSMSA